MTDRPCSEALEFISIWNDCEHTRKERLRKRQWPYEDGKLPEGDKIEMAPMPGFSIFCKHGEWEFDPSHASKWKKVA